MNIQNHTIFMLMGVSGCGKSYIGKSLSTLWNIPFVDGDDFHPPQNVAKMKAGHALNDEDRYGWLAAINTYAQEQVKTNSLLIACSALKAKYRVQLAKGLDAKMQWIYLKGDYELILKRMQARKQHFMPSALLQSQFDTLEEPTDALVIDIAQTPEVILDEINSYFQK